MARVPNLVAADGVTPLRRSELRQEVAAPSTRGVRQIWSGHPAQGLTPQRLATMLKEAETGDATRYLELAEDMEERDPHYSAVLGTRKRQVAQLEILVEPADDEDPRAVEAADLVRSVVEGEAFQDDLIDILDAIGKGYSATEILWETSASQWLPVQFKHRDPRWFGFDPEDGQTLMLRENAGLAPLPGGKFIVHCAKAKSGLPIRGGFARMAGWYYLFKNYAIKDWVRFAELYGQPMRIGKYHPTATEEQKQDLLRALVNLGTDAAAAIPQSMMIEIIEAQKQASSDLYQNLAEFCDKQTSKMILGQTMTTDDGASRAQAEVHDGVREDIERADARQLAATLNRDLTRPLVDLNLGPQTAYPKIQIGRPEQHDPAILTRALPMLHKLGLPLSRRQVYGAYRLAEPDDEADALAPPAPRLPPEGRADPAAAEAALAKTQLPGSEVIAAARAAAEAGPDAIDDAIEAILDGDGWTPMVAPMVDEVRRLAEEVGSLDELLERLEELADIDRAELVTRLAEGGFVARLAGETGAELRDGETDL